MKIKVLRGIPASGKTTLAKSMIKEGIKRVNYDDLRSMMDNYAFSKGNEKFVKHVAELIVNAAREYGYDVILDNVNMKDELEKSMKSKYPTDEIEIIPVDTPIEECLTRDANRERPVGPQTVKRFYTKRLVEDNSNYTTSLEDYKAIYNNNENVCILCDIDGTLAFAEGRDIYDASRCKEDKPNIFLASILMTSGEDRIKLFIMSGREEKFRKETEEWLKDHNIIPTQLFMRATNDRRKDAIVKKELYEAHIKDKYKVLAVFDDRPQVCRMWFEENLPLYKLGHPDREF